MDPFSLNVNLSVSGGPLFPPASPSELKRVEALQYQQPFRVVSPHQAQPHLQGPCHGINPYDVVLGIERIRPRPPPPACPLRLGASFDVGSEHRDAHANLLNTFVTERTPSWQGRFPSRSLPPPISLPSRPIHSTLPTSPRKHAARTLPGSPRRIALRDLPGPPHSGIFAPLGPSPPPFAPLSAHLMTRSHSAPAGSSSPYALPPFANLAGQLFPHQSARRPFSGTEVPLPDIASSLGSILANRRRYEEDQQIQSEALRQQISRQRRELEAALAHSPPEHVDATDRAIEEGRRASVQSPPAAHSAGLASASSKRLSCNAALPGQHLYRNASSVDSALRPELLAANPSSLCAFSDANELFPRRLHPKGRYASKPPVFNAGDPVHMRPRSQAEKFPGDLYTPAIVRAGKSSGKGEAAGGIGTKEAWCGLCEPHQTAASGNGNSLIGGWLNLRNSSYRYHMIRAHGISPRTYRPFREPLQTRKRQPGIDGKIAEGSELKGQCHQCLNWIVFGTREATNFWVHAAKCHREIFIDPRDLQAMEDDRALGSSPGRGLQIAGPDSSAPPKRKALATIDENRSRQRKRTRRSSGSTRNFEVDVDDEEIGYESTALDEPNATSQKEPAWSISRSGRVIKLRDSHWTQDA